MFKFILLVTLCGIMLAQSKPTGDADGNILVDNYSRVARSAQQATNAMKLAGQLANEGIQASTKGMSILSTAAQQGITAGTAIAAQAAKSATSII